MSRVPTTKHGRDKAMDFQGFLNDLQDWELSLKDKDKKLKSQASDKQQSVTSSQKIGKVVEDKRPVRNSPFADYASSPRQYGYSGSFNSMSTLTSDFMTEEDSPDAASEKELGNEYFKQKKFKEAINCYSRSIALSPTAVAYANRAMAYLKVRRFQEAEDDCTEALNLDDRYIKAYSRRATARKELGKLKQSIEDTEFALRLEPHNQEIKKQYAEAKSLLEKEILRKASRALKNSGKGVQNAEKAKVKVNGNVQHVQPVSNGSQRTGVAPIQVESTKEIDRQAPMDTSMSMADTDNDTKTQLSWGAAFQSSGLESVERNYKTGQQELTPSVQELASRAASRAKDEAAKNITPPNSAYQFEVTWRGFAGDRALQARLLKSMSPVALPQIFKNAMSAPILIDIIKCIATFFVEDMNLAVTYIENLTKVSRFDMIIMCLSSTDKADLMKIWDELFCDNSTPNEIADVLAKLRSRYGLKK